MDEITGVRIRRTCEPCTKGGREENCADCKGTGSYEAWISLDDLFDYYLRERVESVATEKAEKVVDEYDLKQRGF